MGDANSKSGSNYVRYVNISTPSDLRDGRDAATQETAPRVAPRAAASQLERFTGSNEPIKSRFTSAARDVTEQQWRALDEGKRWRRVASLAAAFSQIFVFGGSLFVSPLHVTEFECFPAVIPRGRGLEDLLWAATETTNT